MPMFSFFHFTKRNSSQKEAHAIPSNRKRKAQHLPLPPKKLTSAGPSQRQDSPAEPQPVSPPRSTKSAPSNIFSRAANRLRHTPSLTPIQDALARLHKRGRLETASASSTPSTPSTSSAPPNSPTTSDSSPIPDWMSDISLDSDDLRAKQRKSHWKTAAGYISRNGHWIGMTSTKHHHAVDSLQDVHESNVAQLEEEHNQEIAAMSRAFEEEKRRTRAASQRKLIEQKHAVKQLRQEVSEKDKAIAQLQLERQELTNICHRMDQRVLQRDATIDEQRARVFQAEQDANRFARDDMDRKMVEDRNARQARYIHELLAQKEPLEIELDLAKTENTNLKDRVKDLENRLASQQRFIQEAVAKSMNSQIEKVLKENKRIMGESEKHRRDVVILKKKVDEQAGMIKKLDDDNLDQFWQIAFKDKKLDSAQKMITSLRPDTSKAVSLERDLIAANARLARHYTKDTTSLPADVRETMNDINKQLAHARNELQDAQSQITTLKQVEKQHKDCESQAHAMDQTYAFRENIICALQKSNNRAVQMYQELRVKAGLESQVPEPGAVGMDKIHLRAMFEAAAQHFGVKLTEKDFKLCEEQDAEMLGHFIEKAWGHELFDDERILARPLTATERILPSVMKNISTAMHAMIDDMPMPTAPHPVIKDEEKSKPAPVIFATTKGLLDEIRNEAKERASRKPTEEQEEQKKKEEPKGPVVIDLGDGVERKQF